ncbi:MAG: alpha/beta hydrolase [Moraxellaceae bacterium]|jgi:alpha-beta hydrolase superfamily lysophospholipase|nr:alpha/beta hydrolase [Moraxellaceae bacterium]
MITAALVPPQQSLDADAVRRALLRLDLGVYAPLSGVLADYVRFYGLDLENTVPGVRHYLGWVEAYGYRIVAHVFRPARLQGTVFILHGYLDHSALYRHLIADCLRRGHAVFIFDLPGHGLSSGERVDIPDFDHYQHVLADILRQYGGTLPKPFYGIGQSTGAAILMDHVLSAAAAQKKPAFQKVLLLAPLVRPVQWAKIRFGWWLIHHFKRGVPRVFRRNTSDEAFLRFVAETDPLQDVLVPMGWVGALKRWVRHLHALPRTDFPVLLVQGGRDETVEWRYNNRFVRERFRIEHEHLEPEASHQLANERDDLRAPVHAALGRMLGDNTAPR